MTSRNKKIFIIALLLAIFINLSGCAGLLLGSAASVGVATVQERSLKNAAIDLEVKLQIEDALFRTNTSGLFAKVSVTIIEQRVLLVGNVSSIENRDKAEEIAWQTPKVKEVLNEITIKESVDLVDSAKDARISILLSGLLITDAYINDINFSHSVNDQIIYIMGIAQNNDETDKVIQHARTIKGVRKVVSHIILKSDDKRTKDK